MIKAFRYVSFFLIIFIQLSFLLAIFYEEIDTVWIVLFIAVISLLISIGYYHAPRAEENHFIEDCFLIVFVVAGALSTYFCSTQLNFGPVIAASGVGFFASFLPIFNRKSSILKELPEAVYCGAFVGMTAPKVADGIPFILFAGFLTGVILLLSKNVFNGFGGKLGTIAFGGVALTSLLIFLLF